MTNPKIPDNYFDYALPYYERVAKNPGKAVHSTDDEFRLVIEQYRQAENEQLRLIQPKGSIEHLGLDAVPDKAMVLVSQMHQVLLSMMVARQVSKPPMTWAEIARSITGEIVGDVFGEGGAAILHAMIIWQMSHWLQQGRRLFELSPNLCRRLNNLRLQNVPTELLSNLPFSSFGILLPHGEGMPVVDYDGVQFPVRAVQVTLDESEQDSTGVRGPFIRFLVVGQWRPIRAIAGMPLGYDYDDQIFHWPVPLSFRGTLGELVTQMRLGRCFPENKDMDSEAVERLETVAAWLLRLLIYLSDSEIRREVAYLDPNTAKLEAKLRKHSGKKKERAKQQWQQANKQKVIRVGYDLPAIAPGAGKGQPLEVRQYVRGHRKRVRVGEKGQDRKEVYIAPYWRGPEEGEQSISRYLLR